MSKKIRPAGSNEFEAFVSAPESTPARDLSERIFARVHGDLNPALHRVFLKLATIHVFVSGLSLSICSQFGIGRTTSLTHSFMHYGDMVCMTMCGALFLGLTSLIAQWFLSADELRRVRRYAYSPILGLGAVSLLVFIAFGAEIATTFAVAWMLGGLVAGIFALETGFALRRLVHHRH